MEKFFLMDEYYSIKNLLEIYIVKKDFVYMI